ncbi:MAG: ribbon-helix-helix domain-containing protein [Pseudomonadota bacterium]
MPVRKRSVVISGHATSYSVEDAFFQALQGLAIQNGVSLASMVDRIDQARDRETNLSSAIRLFVFQAACRGDLRYFTDQAAQQSHQD